ncbi:hypothetical protein CNMCM5793_005630 [Aspergillus hiratsukae]|uniref:Uncharacterized protein n=1 Tax=Aspergillus hiratsukae TaxID=1194566 RepID=A0A8H6PG72_9EURO|nr:hypothetical protein CNMCM5793_005630 [Aspergillus hiratsukae]KAF7171970.1 hypothetical protein CNMCM6106_006276 [Aspergillus hiratsukae]
MFLLRTAVLGMTTPQLHLLVNDVEKAAQVLQEGGYLRTALSFVQGDLDIPASESSKVCRLVSPTALDQGLARLRSWDRRDLAEILAAIRNGQESLWVPGVALLDAESWAYGPLDAENQEPIPELHDYFNSHVALWLARSYKTRLQDMYLEKVIASMITELDESWSVGFEKGVRVVYRPILFDLMRQTHEHLFYRRRVWGVSCLLTFFGEFREYHRNRVEMEMNLQDLPCPVWSHGFVRERPRLKVERVVERSGGCPNAVLWYKTELPRFTWLVKMPGGEGWIQISMNIFQVIKSKHGKRASLQEADGVYGTS